MIDSFVTRCPHCNTSFRVTRAQLGAARGAVRCGACLQVFNAGQQLLIDQPGAFVQPPLRPSAPPARPTPSPAAAESSAAHPKRPASPPPVPPAAPQAAEAGPGAAKPAAPPPAADDTLWIHDDLDLDSLNLDEELAKLEEEEQQLSQEFLALDCAPKPAERLMKAPDKDAEPHDEAWAEALLRQENAARAEPKVAEPQVQPVPALDLELDEARREPSLSLDDPADLAAADDDLRLGASGSEPDDTPLREPSFSALTPLGRQARARAPLRDEPLLDLSDEPLRLDWQPRKKPWGRWLGWSLLNLVALLALGGQYVAYNFDELARQDRYRPWFEQICPEIGCSLPSKVDITQIKSSNLVVRSHPDFAGALVVDAILYNRAAFAQPFPLLEIRFADLNGQLLASRRFKPSEYLAGELAGQTDMPPQTPIHISLEILDPGPKAVNYSLSFHSPE